MADQKADQSCLKSCLWLLIGAALIALLYPAILWVQPRLDSFFKKRQGWGGSTPTPMPTPPGFSEHLDEMWIECASTRLTNQNWKEDCDDLFNRSMGQRDDRYVAYRNFASSCGGRIELFWEQVSCSTHLKYMAEAPPAGVPVLPWDDKGIRTLCLVGDESYEGVEPDITRLTDKLARNLTRPPFYFVIVENGCDASLTVMVRGNPLSGVYMGAGVLYSGAVVTGRISLTAPGFSALTHTLDGSISPPEDLTWFGDDPPYQTPASAPFWDAVESQLDSVFTDWFGPEYAGNWLH